MEAPRFVDVACQVCGERDGEPAYARELETAAAGRVRMQLLLCPSCGFLFQSPRLARAHLSRFYADSSDASGAVWHASGAGSRQAELCAARDRFARRALELAGTPRERGSVLDVGCSQGDLLAALDLPGWHKVGLEPSAAAGARARERGLEVVRGTLDWHDFPRAWNGPSDGGFDLVTCMSVLEHVWDVRDAMSSLEALVRPGGTLVLDVPDSTRPVPQIAEFFSFEHLSHFTAATLARLLAGFGFRIVLVEPRGDCGLLVGARREGRRSVGAPALADERTALAAALQRYRKERESFERSLRERFELLARGWRARSARIALHGAGEHTRFLLDLVDLGESVIAVLDSDPTKHGQTFLRWTVRAPEEAAELGADAILLSSRPFQEEMARALAPLARAHGIELVRCYPQSGG